MANKKPNIENRKVVAGKKLSTRVAFLESEGMSADKIQRDFKVRQFKADVRKANRQLTDIAELESLLAQRAEEKARKLAAPEAAPPKKKRSPSDPTGKKAKKERKMAAETAGADE